MSEVAEDLQATDATPVSPSDTAGAVQVAGDLFDSSESDDMASSDAAEPSDAPAFDPDNVDWLRVNPDDVPEQYRPLSGVARIMQSQFTRTQQDLRDRERAAGAAEQQAQAQQAQIQALQGQLAAYQQPAQATAPADQWMQNLNEEEQRGIGIVDWRAQEQIKAVANPLLERLNALEQQTATHNGFIQKEGERFWNQQIVDAEAAYSPEQVEQYRPFILANVSQVNPATGQQFTVKEVMDLFSGATAASAAEVRQNDEAVRKTSKSRARTSSSATPASDDSGPLSKGELMAEMGKLGFE